MVKISATRIIGGRYGSRKITFLPIQYLRPTSHRIRETLFNWIGPLISGHCCLDAFAGSGALGIEAISRGASSVQFIEKNREQCSHLKSQLLDLRANSEVANADFFTWIETRNTQSFDMIFLDPPFSAELWQKSFKAIERNNAVKMNGYVYLEHPIDIKVDYSDNWTLMKSKVYGRVAFNLLRRVA